MMIYELFATHFYLLAALGFFTVWLLLLPFLPKNKRKALIIISLSTMVLGYFVEQMHFTDWWQPNFVFNTPITFEDMMFGFGFGGVVYAFNNIFSRHLSITPNFAFSLVIKIFLVSISLVSLFGLFYILHVHSFLSSVFTLCIPIVIVAVYDRRLLLPSILVGVAVTIIATLGYLLVLYMNPHFVGETYLLSQLTGILVLGVPIEEFVWFFFAGTGGATALSILEF